ncbi:unnamed protein product [Nippostrongylus brasiliensis]|uniref:Zinc transporter ZIP14 (inferred by orthology to a human protein) n=1 Tax=Nippostrongylus brasiliensis TaxID=27835 RepID=A0A158QWS2_NIPBR|nr:unnamed protein product [Nippostrongylus brasiliensis]
MADKSFSMNASDLIHDVIGEAFRAAKLENYTQALNELDKPERWQTPLGMLVLPCLKKALYERIMIFLIALGIGALSGSSMFIMIPQAFHLTELDDFNYHSKSAIVVGALYVFFTVDRILQYALELRRVRNGAVEIPLTNGSAANGTSKEANVKDRVQTCSEADLEEREKAELAEEVEIAMLNNAFARTFSTRKRLAVMSAIDAIELRDPRGREGETSRRNSFVDVVNNDISRNQDHFLEVVHNDVSRKKDDDEVSVSVKIVEKHVIDPSTIEVASVAYMIIFGSSANNFVDGMSMGAAFSDSLLRGLSIGVAVVSQQFPQELGTLAILINSGLGFRRAMLYNLIPILLSYLGFICGVLLDNVDEGYDDYIFSISSGMYLYIFLGTLIPEIREGCNELMKVDMKESLIVTVLQYCGIASGICFMYYMSTVGDVEL